MFEAIKYNLANLANFAGRDSRPTFWWYVLFLVVLQFAIGIVASIPLVFGAIGSAVDSAQSGAGEEAMQAQIMQEMAANIGTTVWVGAITELAIALLLLAALVRRLHDSGKSGWLAALPFVAKLVTLGVAVTRIDEARDIILASADPAQAQQMQAEMVADPVNLLSWAAILLVVIFGVLKPDDGPNSYGADQR